MLVQMDSLVGELLCWLVVLVTLIPLSLLLLPCGVVTVHGQVSDLHEGRLE